MPKTQNKNNIAWAILSLTCLLLGEGLFSVGIYLVPLLKIAYKDWGFFVALGIGVLASLVTGSQVGLISLLLIIYILLVRFLNGIFRDNLLILGLLAVLFNFVIDRASGSLWNVWEGVLVFSLVLAIGVVGSDHDLRLRG